MSQKEMQEEQAQNQQQVIDSDEQIYYTPTSQKRLNFDDSGPMEDEEYEDDEQAPLTRSNAFVGRTHYPEKEPMHGFGVQSQALTSSDEEEEPGECQWDIPCPLHPKKVI